jgi:hypothetical protein
LFDFFYLLLNIKRFLKHFLCDLIFEQEGIYEYVVIDELQNDLIQIDDDLLSMEYPEFFTNYFLVRDYLITKILLKLILIAIILLI